MGLKLHSEDQHHDAQESHRAVDADQAAAHLSLLSGQGLSTRRELSHHRSSSYELRGEASVVLSDDEQDPITAASHNDKPASGYARALPTTMESRRSSIEAHYYIEDNNNDTNNNINDSDSDSDIDSQKSQPPPPTTEKPVTWSSLPKKGQLAILTCARLSEPLTQTSLQAYLFYQLRSFDPTLPDSTISKQAGMLQASFTVAQFLTAMWWGRLADADWMGRKRVLLIGLFGTCISCVGFGFSKSFVTAALFRTLGGVLNSNVGVMRTMIAEIIEEKKYQSRAFLLLPMCFNIGVIIGPVLGGMLADPVANYPGVFGPGSTLGGKDGVWWMQTWPYALPNVISAFFLFCSMLALFLGLDETHEVARYRDDWGRSLGRALVRSLRRYRVPRHYRPLRTMSDAESVHIGHNTTAMRSLHPSSPRQPLTTQQRPKRPRPSIRQMLTRNVILTLCTHFLLAFHVSAFNSMIFIFLPTPRSHPDEAMTTRRDGVGKGGDDFFHFSGGLGLPSSRVGLATAIIGIIGLPLQLLLYPRVQSHLGTLSSFRTFLPFSPLAYTLMPFLVLIPRVVPFGWLVWVAFTFVVGLQVVSRTFSLPAAIILVNNCVTDPAVLGTLHGFAQSVSSAARTLGPLIGGWGLGMGLQYNMVGAIWWALAVEALVGWALLWTIHEGKGIERRRKGGETRVSGG